MAIIIISVAQVFKLNNSGNYENDYSEYFADFLNTTVIGEIEIDTSSLNEDLKIDAIQNLYYLTGRTNFNKKIFQRSLKLNKIDEKLAEVKLIPYSYF
jgi:hypothetical protein